jgi:hypothetical protein
VTTTNRAAEVRPAAAFARAALLTAGAAALLLLIGYFPTRALAGPDGPTAMALGIGTALLAALAGLLPPMLTLRLGTRERTGGALAGMAVRFVLMLGLLLAAMLSGAAQKLPLALWAAIGYIVFLAVDVAALIRLGKCAVEASE